MQLPEDDDDYEGLAPMTFPRGIQQHRPTHDPRQSISTARLPAMQQNHPTIDDRDYLSWTMLHRSKRDKRLMIFF